MDSSALKTLRIQIFGNVQGVFFRDHTRRKAEALQLVGWVKNCPDGSVESIISGKEADVNRMVEWFNLGSPFSSVKNIIIQDMTIPPAGTTFLIQY